MKQFFLKIVRFILVFTLVVISSPVWLFNEIYELSPARRKFKAEFEKNVLEILERKGETTGRNLRHQIHKELKLRGDASFWINMYRIENKGLVTRRIEPAVKVIGNKKIEFQHHYFSLNST